MKNWLKISVLGVEIIVFTLMVYFLIPATINLLSIVLWLIVFDTSTLFFHIDYIHYLPRLFPDLGFIAFWFIVWQVNKNLFSESENSQINFSFLWGLFINFLFFELYRDITLFINDTDWLNNENGSPLLLLFIIYSLFVIAGIYLFKKHKSVLGK
jgi:hypothetical protein